MLKDIRKNPIMLTDCYNLSHQLLKCDTTYEVSHFYNRAAGMILYGFQETIQSILSVKITSEMVFEAEIHAKRMNLPFPREIWMRVVTEFHGYIPIEIQVLPEGTWCPKGTPFAQVRNSVDGMGEMVTWLEGIMMMAYFPSACATRAYYMRDYLEKKKDQYGYDDSFLWRFHSFGFRGHRSLEDAYFAGTAWNLFLKGTDDFHIAKHMPTVNMGSICALAHKVTQQFESEYTCFTHAIDVVDGNEGVVALVIDTYDADRVINQYVKPLAEYAKSKGVHLVFRPDSGDVKAQAVRIYQIVFENGFDNVSVIIGEGMSFTNAIGADAYFIEHNVPLNFINYGIGAGFYKDLERDTLGWAMKTAYSNGAPRMKLVKSDPFKQSIPGVVNLKYANSDADKLTVYSEDVFSNTAYKVIYNHDKSFDKPVMAELQSVEETLAYVKSTTANGLQTGIILDTEVQDLIQVFKKKYE